MYKMNDENLDQLVSEIFDDLDVPSKAIAEAKIKYLDLGRWLQDDSQTHYKTDSLLYVQGSTLLGTAVRPIKRTDEYDFDLVYRRDLAKESITQKELKKQVGEQLSRYIKHLKEIEADEIPILEESTRCWTLRYPGKFHMDILPALPDLEPNYAYNSDDGIIITDHNLSRWQFSNPKGFNAWFRQSMRIALHEARIRLAKSANVEIEAIPEDSVKTTLQKAVQILKRHRDSTYKGNQDDKPISIIITTVATKAYNNSENLYIALCHIVKNMAGFIESRNGELWVQNPINEKENFADKWNKHSIRHKEFMTWLESAQIEFTSLQDEADSNRLNERLFKSLKIDTTEMVRNAHRRAGLSAAASAVTVKTDPWTS